MIMSKLISGFFLKTLALAAITGSAMFFAPAAHAAQGGFEGPGPDVVTAQQAAQMKDDANVTLKGNIVEHLGGDKYLFRDASGTIIVEIDNDEWNGQSVKPEDTVTIFGEVDKDWNETSVDADRIVKE